MATQTLLTAAEFMALPDNGLRQELVDGELFETPPPETFHYIVIQNLNERLAPYVRSQVLGRIIAEGATALLTEPATIRQPDLIFIVQDRLHLLGLGKGYFPGAPDAAFEVVSPSDRAADLDYRLHQYRLAGVKATVVIQPRTQTVRIHRQDGTVTEIGSAAVLTLPELFGSWQMPVADLFAL